MRTLTLGMIYPPHDMDGGYERTWHSAVEFMRECGDDVRVLASDWRRPDREGHAEGMDVHRELRTYWREYGFPSMTTRERLAVERDNAATLDQHLADFNPDSICWWSVGGMSLSLIERVRRAGLPAVGIVGDDWMRWGFRADAWIRMFARRPWLGAVTSRLTGIPTQVDLSSAATWLFNSEAMRRSALANHPDLAQTEVVHPGINDEAFTPVDPGPWSWRLLCLGRLDPRKGVHVAIRALCHLPEETTLTVQGTGDVAYLRELRELVGQLGLVERVKFTQAPKADIARVYSDADALLFPVQWEEPWGLVPLEAMRVGRPVIATGTGGSAEYLRDRENCVLYAPKDDAAALAAAVCRLAENEDSRRTLVAGGYDTASRFTETAYNRSIRKALFQAARSS